MVEVKKVKQWALNGSVMQNGPSTEDRGVRQGNLYVHGARLGLLGEDRKGIDKLLLVWVTTEAIKGEPGLFAWEIPYSQEMAEKDLQRLSELKFVADYGELPAPPPPRNLNKRWNYTFGSWPCGWCSYRTRCYDEAPEGRRGK